MAMFGSTAFMEMTTIFFKAVILTLLNKEKEIKCHIITSFGKSTSLSFQWINAVPPPGSTTTLCQHTGLQTSLQHTLVHKQTCIKSAIKAHVDGHRLR